MLLDVALLVLEYLSLASIEIAFKALVYSVKLKMEFAILNKLVESSSLAQQSFSKSLSNTVTQEDDRSSSVVARHLENPFAKTTSYERNVSEVHLPQQHTNSTDQTVFGRVTPDSYHDTLRTLSKAKA